MDVHGILGADPEVCNGFSGIKVTYAIDADASREAGLAIARHALRTRQ
jgi:hypothetical protein